MTDDYAGELIANVLDLRAKSFEALPEIYASCHSLNIGNDEFEVVLLAIHAQEMFRRNMQILARILRGEKWTLTDKETESLAWLQSAAEMLESSIETMRHNNQLWVPDPVRKALVPFKGDLPW